MTLWVATSPTQALTPTAIALGNFDGVHQGHQRVIQPIIALGLRPVATVVTFHPHPREFFSGQPQSLLTPPGEKVQHLQTLGVQQLLLLPFDRELAHLSPNQFVETIMVRQLQATQVSVGEDFCFGYQRQGTAADLKAIATSHGIKVTVVPLTTSGGERISSSAIRQALEQGDLQRAKRLLGRPYSLMGQVVLGQKLGRTLGFPTANVQVPPGKFLPCYGVYAVQVSCGALGLERPGVMNVGCRPTVAGRTPTIEVHLLDWAGDLYGQSLQVSLEAYLRPEQKFTALAALKAQIQRDCDRAREELTLPTP